MITPEPKYLAKLYNPISRDVFRTREGYFGSLEHRPWNETALSQDDREYCANN